MQTLLGLVALNRPIFLRGGWGGPGRSRGLAARTWGVRCLWFVLLLWPAWVVAQAYRQPSPAIRTQLDAGLPVRAFASPEGRWLALLEPARYVPLSELARPNLKLAGLRFDPANRSALPAAHYLGLKLRALQTPRQAERRVVLPGGGLWHSFAWSPGGEYFLLQRRSTQASELWVGNSSGGSLRRIEGVQLNNLLGDGELVWWGPQELMVLAVAGGSKAPPAAPLPGPMVQENTSRASPEPAHADLLRTDHDEALFAHHARSQMVRINLANGSTVRLGEPGFYFSISAVGKGQALLTERLLRPFSRQLTWDDFPQVAELRDPQGKLLRELARLPARHGVPLDGVLGGPRVFYASPQQDAAVYWVEALDGGNPQTKVAYRDRLMRLDPPYKAEAREVQRLPHRFSRMRFLDDGLHALVTELDRSRLQTRTYLQPLDGSQSRLLFEHAQRERFRHPGSPLMRLNANGHRVIQTADDGSFWFVGQGASAKGERPFLDRYSLSDQPVQRIFQAEGQVELPIQWLDENRLLTQVERPYDMRQLGLRDLGPKAAPWQALSAAGEPLPGLKSLRREYVSFKRDDGVDMAFWMVLPPDMAPGEKRPALVWAYPLEFTDAQLASQQAAPSDRQPTPPPGSPVWLALDGFVVIYDATMPVVGDARSVNDTFLEQIQRNARAIVEKLDDLGQVDLRRIAIGGQSYGAFMAVNLLAHTNLFKAGIARSGAYNRTLTPFGFQSERRNLWEARDAYLRLSPLLHANRISEPLLLLHGEQDTTPGTPAMQSERMFQALAGLGQPVRLTLLPLEGHALLSREAAGHVQWEMSNWLRRHLGEPKPR
jgi:dipeptidyl aminopeptidase/acylaminoacyl peptidase